MKLFLYLLFFLSMNTQAATDLIAINIALIPDQPLVAVAKKMNATTTGFHFDETHFPHVTLVQGIVKKSDLPKIEKIVSSLQTSKIELHSSRLEKKEGLVNLNFYPNPEVQKLEEKIVSAVSPYLQKSADKEAFYEPKSVREKDVDYAKSFVPEKSGKNFSPHMTMGLGTTDSTTGERETDYTFGKIGIFQIGEWGTARKKL